MDNFFSNEEIVFLFEQNAMVMIAGERYIKDQEKQLKDLENLTSDNPIAKAIANIISGMGNKSTDQLKDFKEALEVTTKKHKLISGIVNSLSLPYYAITGRTMEDMRKDYDEKGHGQMADAIRLLLKR